MMLVLYLNVHVYLLVTLYSTDHRSRFRGRVAGTANYYHCRRRNYRHS